jgi:hypothetical protein
MNETQQNILELTQRALALMGRTGAVRTFVVTLPSSIPAGAAVERQATPLQFQEPGMVLAMYGQEETATAAKYAKTKVRVQIGADDLFSDGQAGTFASMLALFPPATPWYPILRRVVPAVPWTVSFRNTDTGAVAVPEVEFSFIADADLKRLAR